MHAFSSSISRRIKHKLRAKNPDLFLYMDNPYVEELFDSLIDIVAEEIADIRNDYISKDDINRRL